ncbi:MAG TPA: hypothetical protein VJT49_09865 [Amycolatopsis sp.]|nr:hypothetical protein [Amycolatopsis sp.]HKS45404.1 hypothetical protein [Amycolatopsis sp.]
MSTTTTRRGKPISRFWDFQVIEASGLLVLTVLFGVATLAWVRRRIS